MIKILPLALLLLLCLGCASPLSGARTSYAAARAVYDAAEGRYRAEQEACLSSEPPEPCVAAVRERWRPLRKPADALRSLLIAFAGSLAAYDALSKAGRAPSPSALADASGKALEAAEALAAALSTVGVP